jgi:hypothetical protein
VGIQDEDIAIQDEDIAIQDGDLGIQDEDLGIQDEDLGIQDEDMAIQDEDIAIQDEDIAIQDEDLAIQDEDMAIQDEDMAIRYFECDGSFRAMVEDGGRLWMKVRGRRLGWLAMGVFDALVVGCSGGAGSSFAGADAGTEASRDATVADSSADAPVDATRDAPDGTARLDVVTRPDVTTKASEGGTALDAAGEAEAGSRVDAAVEAQASSSVDASVEAEASTPADAGVDAPIDAQTDGPLCYGSATPATVHTLQANRDRLVADLAKRKCTDSCTLWASLNQAERYVFLMVTTYLGDTSSRLYPPSYDNLETALDHAVAMYTINGPMAGQGTDGSGRGGFDYNRIYLGFDPLAECVMRNFPIANPADTPGYNKWVKSDDVEGPHHPFTQREMIFWYKTIYDLQSNGPQFHHWHQDSDFTQAGINVRLGVCGVTDLSLSEMTIAFDAYHNSDPLGDYATMGGYGWQIVSQRSSVDAGWDYTPTSCAVTPPVNTDPYGGGTFAGMGPSLDAGGCYETPITDGGC